MSLRGTGRLLAELGRFLWHDKRWWLAPVVVAIVVLSILFVASQSSALAPLIYTIF